MTKAWRIHMHMRYSPSEIKKLVVETTKSVYEKMGLVPGQRYTASELQEAYGRYLLEADEGSDAGFTWMIKFDEKRGVFNFYGIRANGDTQLEVKKGSVGEEGAESRFKPVPKNAARDAQNIVKWKTNKEGWHTVPSVPASEEDAYAQYGEKFGTHTNYDDVMMQRGEAELAKREKMDTERTARKAAAAPRGLQDAEGNSNRKIYGKRDGFSVHTGLKGKRFYPKDTDGNPFQSKFKAGQFAKVRAGADGNRVTVSGKVKQDPTNKNSPDVDHTQDWGTNEAFQQKLKSLVMECILNLSDED